MKLEEKAIEATESTRRAVRIAAVVLLLSALGFVILAWRNPLWLVDRQIDAKLKLHGVHSNYVAVNGYRMHYLVGGSGRPLLLVGEIVRQYSKERRDRGFPAGNCRQWTETRRECRG